jgi:hypothetical protein
MDIFPGFSTYGVVSPAIIELATTFNAEGINALAAIPEKAVRWADVGTRVTKLEIGQGKIPVDVTPLQGFEPFEGERRYHQVNVDAVTVKVNPFQLNHEWDIRFGRGEGAKLVNFYGLQNLPQKVVAHARALKADMVEALIEAGLTNPNIPRTDGVGGGMSARALVLSTGIPLFSDGHYTAPHYANPIDTSSKQFINCHYGAGKITDTDTIGKVMMNLNNVPHASKLNMTMGLTMTDLIGPPHMLIPFFKAFVQNLALEINTGASAFAATTNIYNPESIAKAQAMVGVSGVGPWRFWIAPQLNAHPYVVANPGKHMWLALAQSPAGGAFCELGAPSPEFTPELTLMGDGTEDARKRRKISLLGDLDAGVAAGLPHFAQMYFETDPGSPTRTSDPFPQ